MIDIDHGVRADLNAAIREAGGAHTVTMPGWFRRQIEDREASGASFFDPKFASTFQGFAPLDQESAA